MKVIRNAILGIGLCLSWSNAVVKIKYGITFGPVWNWSFGKNGNEFTGGLNIAYWDFRNEIPWSINFGYESSITEEILVYSEIQSGAILAGGTAGILYSSQKGLGWQSSIWANIIAGGNLRVRYLRDFNLVAGTYITLPIMKTEGSLE